MKKIIHLIPYDGIGGVESASNTMQGLKNEYIEFEIFYIFNKQRSKWNYFSSLNPAKIFSAARKLKAKKPDLIIVSLWRSCIVATILKLFSPKTKIILFLHYPHHYHLADMFFTKIVSAICDGIWADSQDTLISRIPSFPLERSDVISFVARRLEPSRYNENKPDFIFWGRLHEQKCIDRAINIFAKIQSKYHQATFTIIGPDGGELNSLKNLVNKLGITKSINFTGPQDLDSIKAYSNKASFYLQTSKLEGMAMSVVEAMQLGLLPVVTPVGEIKSYCEDKKNALLVSDDSSAIDSIINLLKNEDLYSDMKNRAILKWKNHEIYSESVIRASKKALNIIVESK